MTLAIFVSSLLGAMALGMPIAFALLLCGIALMHYLDIFDAQIVAQNVINGADSFPLLAVPFFMLAGEIMNVGGLSKRLVDLAIVLVGHVKGGLGYVAILASVFLAALSGSAVADAAALSALLVPMMVAAGHNRAYAGGLIAASGIIAPVIPPSIGFVVFGVVGGVSITKLFLAGIVPGLLLAIGVCVAWWWVVRKEEIVSPPKRSGREVIRALRESFWALLLPFIIIFGLKFGIFTPTEAAVVAAVYALFVTVVIYRELKPSEIYGVFVTSAKTTGGGDVPRRGGPGLELSHHRVGDSDRCGDMLQPFLGNQTLLLLAFMALVVIIGTAMDMTPTILIMTPILMPVIRRRDRSGLLRCSLHYQQCHRLITPPVARCSTCGRVSKISMEDIMKGVWPFMVAQLIVRCCWCCSRRS
jgi:tripartite ATP-independent transporter DctM subunit